MRLFPALSSFVPTRLLQTPSLAALGCAAAVLAIIPMPTALGATSDGASRRIEEVIVRYLFHLRPVANDEAPLAAPVQRRAAVGNAGIADG